MVARLRALDERLLAVPRSIRATVILLTLVVMAWTALPQVPRPAFDLSAWPILSRVAQPDTFGTDTIADTYEARVVRHSVRDMYTKVLTPQTPVEAATWTREASSPYPPATLLALAALSAVGDRAGVGLYGMTALFAVVFLALSLAYFWNTRWYLFPLLYLNFGYLAGRFFFVQDGSYLVMLVTIMAGLFVVGRRPAFGHLLMAFAAIMKFTPIFYASFLGRMTRPTAAVFVAILLAGLALPYLVWDNYLYIFRYNSELKGDWVSALGAAIVAVPMAVAIWRLDRRGLFDDEERIGWALVPVAVYFALSMNAARHLILVLLIPDKRGLRNIAAAAGLALPAVMPSLVGLNSAMPLTIAILIAGLYARASASRPSLLR